MKFIFQYCYNTSCTMISYPLIVVLITMLSTILGEVCFYQGEECTSSKFTQGECVRVEDCKADSKRYIGDGEQMLREGEICRNGYDGEPLVCCERRYKVSRGGVGGVNALSQTYPHMAALGYGNDDDIEWNCGGSLITSYFVLTAAHCLFQGRDPVRKVRLGDLVLSIHTDDEEIQEFAVKNMYRHPDYKQPKKYNDIALLELNRSIYFSPYVYPACMLEEGEVCGEECKVLYATGWGLLGDDGEKADHLQEMKLQEFTKDECKERFPQRNRTLPFGIQDSQLCAGSEKFSIDTCKGDSGGPLQYKIKKDNPKLRFFHSGPFVIYGVTSYGEECGHINVPAIYTRVASYLSWIKSIVIDNNKTGLLEI